MDFIRVGVKELKDGTREFFPALLALESQDLVIRGGQFAAIWDEDTQLYSRRLSHVPGIIDRAFSKMVGDEYRSGDVVKKMRNFDNQLYNKLLSLIRNIGDMGPELDQSLVFADQQPTKSDAATFKMPYSLSDTPCPAWDKICEMLYAPEERIKFEWAIGSILTGRAATEIQKFYVFYGPPGSGKSTIMNVIEMLFEGHTASFSAYDMGKADAQFSLEPFSKNPLVAIDQDGDLSRIEVNKNLNSIVSHDRVLINAKGKNLYPIVPRSTLFIGSNDPVKISNRKSGLFRRLVDIQPTGLNFEEKEYHTLMDQVRFELGAIAQRCIYVFEDHGSTYLSSYRSTEMMYRTNDVFNFVEDNRLILSKGVTLKQAHKLYSEWCEQTDTRNIYKQFQFRDLLADYFNEFHDEKMVDGERHRSYFMGLKELEKFSWKGLAPKPTRGWLELDTEHSLLDEVFVNMPAQVGQDDPLHPLKYPWEKVTTTLKDINTSEEHYVKVPTQHIVIDFDLRDEHGKKDLARNIEAAGKWPSTYAEVSRGGGGLHLHYDYDGDVERLASVDPNGEYEVKTLLGGSSLRRRVSLCNALPVATISSGLPLKEEKVLTSTQMTSEKQLRARILKGLRKEVHPYTKPSMDFIEMVLKEAHESGMTFDVSDMWDDIFAFAMSSSNQRGVCIDKAMALKLASEEEPTAGPDVEKPEAYFDIEVYPNLVAIGWMLDSDDAKVVKMVNPSPSEVEDLVEKTRLIGFNNRVYDNHILWALMLGWDNEAIYRLSKAIIGNERSAMFGQAYNLAYGDLYDIIVEKRSLKWWEIKLGLPHMEMDLPWDEPVPEDRLLDVLDYLENDVKSTRAVAKHRDADFRARQILAELTGLAVCNTNRQHTEKLVFGENSRESSPDLEYTDLREMFPGYSFDQFAPGKDKSTYKGMKVGEGGLVYAVPGMYENVALLDVASMHPTSIVEMNVFGKNTPNFKALLDARLSIKKGDYETAAKLYDGRLAPYLGDKATAKGLSDALKIVINSVYGLTAASFPNMFRDPRNVDNIVAKRGALFMVDLKEFVEETLGKTVIHIKTDSIKVADLTDTELDSIMEFGRKYGYDFELEATYERFCLVNDAVYVARAGGSWSATGAQFQHPVVFKTLFSGDEIITQDYVEVKQVAKGVMYLVTEQTEAKQFVGRFGAFIPVHGGRRLLRIDGEKEAAVTGTKDHLWELDELAINSDEFEIDMTYFQNLVDEGKRTIEKFGSYAAFTRP